MGPGLRRDCSERGRVEDEGFVDDDFIADGAREYAGRYGMNAVPMLHERARIASAAGSFLLAQAWQEMAEQAEALLGWI
jgi:hypothetical protein